MQFDVKKKTGFCVSTPSPAFNAVLIVVVIDIISFSLYCISSNSHKMHINSYIYIYI